LGLGGTSPAVLTNDQPGFNWQNDAWNKVEIELSDLDQFHPDQSKLHSLRVHNHNQSQDIYLRDLP
jgi:hypothetical protein